MRDLFESEIVTQPQDQQERTAIAAKPAPLRVLSVAHSAFADGSSRVRYYSLAGDEGMDLTLLVPAKWSESGKRGTIGSDAGPLKIKVGKVLLQTFPKINWHGHFYPAFGKLLRELSPAVLHLWEEPWSAAALHATLLRDRYFPKMALVIETEQNVLRRLPPPFEWMRRYTLRRTDLLIARSEEALDVSMSCGYNGPASLVDYSLSTQVFRPVQKEWARAEFGIEGFTLGYAGRFVLEKGLITVLNALRTCKWPVNLALMGSGPAAKEITNHIVKLGLESRVQIFPPGPQQRVALFMNAIDALVLMSETTRTWKEQFGRVIIEAQACGTPVIGSNSGSIPYVTGEGGWITPERDAESLASLLDVLHLDAGARREAGGRALKNVERFTPEIVGATLRDAFIAAQESRARVRHF